MSAPFVRIGTPPHPLPQASVSTPSEPKGERSHSPAGKGGGGSQSDDLEKKPSTLSSLWPRGRFRSLIGSPSWRKAQGV